MTHARLAGTYRAARRNDCRAPLQWSPAWYFAGSHKAHGHRGAPRYVAYQIRAPRLKMVLGVPLVVERKQPKTYRGPSQREQARRMRETQRFMRGII